MVLLTGALLAGGALAGGLLQERQRRRAQRNFSFGDLGTSFTTPGGGGARIKRDPVTGEVVDVQITESPFARSFRERGEAFAGDIAGAAQGVLGDIGPQQRVEDATFQAALRRLNPQFEERERNIRNRLAQQGLPVGSEAFEGELNRLENLRNRSLEEAAFGAIGAGREQQRAAVQNLGALLQQRQSFAPNQDALRLALGQGQARSQFSPGLSQFQQAQEARRQRSGALFGLAGQGIGALFGGGG